MPIQAWVEKGLKTKYLVCKFAFKVSLKVRVSIYMFAPWTFQRIPGQPALPVREECGKVVESKVEDAPEAKKEDDTSTSES
jgi:hypothetical protein